MDSCDNCSNIGNVELHGAQYLCAGCLARTYDTPSTFDKIKTIFRILIPNKLKRLRRMSWTRKNEDEIF